MSGDAASGETHRGESADATSGTSGTSGSSPQDLFAGRMGEYQEIWEAATAKMMTGTYRSEDLVDDWFRWWGRAARDMTAAATLAFGSVSPLQGARPQTNDTSGSGGVDDGD